MFHHLHCGCAMYVVYVCWWTVWLLVCRLLLDVTIWRFLQARAHRGQTGRRSAHVRAAGRRRSQFHYQHLESKGGVYSTARTPAVHRSAVFNSGSHYGQRTAAVAGPATDNRGRQKLNTAAIHTDRPITGTNDR